MLLDLILALIVRLTSCLGLGPAPSLMLPHFLCSWLDLAATSGSLLLPSLAQHLGLGTDTEIWPGLWGNDELLSPGL